jgi:hypothetical protein
MRFIKTYPVILAEKYHMPKAPKKMGMEPKKRDPLPKCPSEEKEGQESENRG